jgi:hypothetical protein
MVEVLVEHSEKVAGASKEQITTFKNLIGRKISRLSPDIKKGQVRREKTENLEFYYQKRLADRVEFIFAVHDVNNDLVFEFGLDGDGLVRSVLKEDAKADPFKRELLTARPLSFEEVNALIFVMRKPRAFTSQNPPGIIALNPEEAAAVAVQPPII